LNFTAKYISNKQIDPAKSNDIEDFKGIGEAIWNLISSVYQFKWDSLIANKNSNTLRQKISLKFTSKVILVSNKSNNTIGKLVPASIKKIPPPIPTKSSNISRISNWQQLQNHLKNHMHMPLKLTTSTAEVIKIKDAFLALGTKKIDQIQNIVKGML